jgi:uncharacterized membrane protein YqhA
MNMSPVVRITLFLISIVLVLNAIFLVLFGLYKCYLAYSGLFNGTTQYPAVTILSITDIFFLGLVLMISGIGIAKLFLPGSFMAGLLDLPWMRINNLSQLKHLLWETLMLALVIFFIVILVEKIHDLDYSILYIPCCILLLTFSGYLLKRDSGGGH